MISSDEKARRIALGRHAGGFLRALAGDRKGIAAMVCREIGGALLRSAVNLEGETACIEHIPVSGRVVVSAGGDA